MQKGCLEPRTARDSDPLQSASCFNSLAPNDCPRRLSSHERPRDATGEDSALDFAAGRTGQSRVLAAAGTRYRTADPFADAIDSCTPSTLMT